MGVECEPVGKFKAADKKSPILITNVHVAMQEADIENYIKSKTQETVNLKKMNTKKQKGHNSCNLSYLNIMCLCF